MGKEVNSEIYTKENEKEFRTRLREETKILKRHFDQGLPQIKGPTCGMELEAWLVNSDFIPAPDSDEFLHRLDHELVVPEISRFNFELNSLPYPVRGAVFSVMENDLKATWHECQDVASEMGLRAIMIGSLPTLRDYMLSMEHLSPQKRYYLLNQRVMESRGERPVTLDIEGKDSLYIKHQDIITECSATSLQVHYEVCPQKIAKYYNASIVSSAFVSAVSANSPFLYGQQLWDDTRIKVFEQSVELFSFRDKNGDLVPRVGLGQGYVHDSIFEIFLENLDGFDLLLPEVMESRPEKMDHLTLHNGTVWRWNRPLIGFNEQNQPNLRLEFRVPSAGPSISDVMTNMVFQIGVVEYIQSIENFDQRIPFANAKENFYLAAKHSFDAEINWLDGKKVSIQELLADEVLPGAIRALEALEINRVDLDFYLKHIMQKRILSGQNGANWQKAFIQKHGSRFQEMMEVYFQQQERNLPIHCWSL